MHKLLAGVLLTAAAALAQTAGPAWLPVSDSRFEINGLPWLAENENQLIRLPLRLKDAVPKPVWGLAQSPSGGRIRFRTDSNTLAIRLEYPSAPNMPNMHTFGQTGVDLYLDGIYLSTAKAPLKLEPGVPVEHTYFDFKSQPRKEREVTLYLPLYMGVKVLGIGLDKDARITKAKPFALPKPIVFYGTSITQGGCASRPGMSYQAILGRILNVDYVNLGFSGNGKGEPVMARALAEIDAECFVLDFAQNNGSVESLQKVYDPFIATLREKYPEIPILCVTPISNSREGATDIPPEMMRRYIRQVVSKRIGAGDGHLQLIEGTDLLGPDRLDGLVDGVHPNDLGFRWMGEGMAARVAKIFGLKLEQGR
ncbi:MAG TPA: SGNH/GDSL hydrolase family protein [Bryobacteraceae bacterium]|nr:SGNH/GDSL hydrolase family protein [Bryobacteraceae bacterium]